VRRALASLFASAAIAVPAGCGGGEVSSGATVSAYVVSPFCSGAKRELARAAGRAGSVRVRIICLPSPLNGAGLSLAAIGAGARRATEDSTAVGYIAAPQPAAIRFSRPILSSAGIASIYSDSGSVAMTKLLKAIRAAGSSGSLRGSVLDELH
jgi:hypothetical protein